MEVNFSAVPANTWAGRVLRWPLNLIPEGITVPIVQGSLRGKKWIVGSSNHGCWLGSYEYTKQRLFEELVSPGDVVYDVGANVGFYTLLAAVLVGQSGRVVAFEPLAVYDRSGMVRITDGPNSSEVRVDDHGVLSVRAFALDDLVFRDGLPAATVMKIDVEGAEEAVLRGATRLLAEKRPLVFLSTHGPQVHGECCRLLAKLGYTLRPIDGASAEVSPELLAQG
jgi:hypothetical protein